MNKMIAIAAMVLMSVPALASESASTAQPNAGRTNWICTAKDRVGFTYTGQWYDRAHAAELAMRNCNERSNVTGCYIDSCRTY